MNSSLSGTDLVLVQGTTLAGNNVMLRVPEAVLSITTYEQKHEQTLLGNNKT